MENEAVKPPKFDWPALSVFWFLFHAEKELAQQGETL